MKKKSEKKIVKEEKERKRNKKIKCHQIATKKYVVLYQSVNRREENHREKISNRKKFQIVKNLR